MLSPFLKKLLFARQLHFADGEVEILGQKQVMLPAALLIELERINPEKVYAIIKDSIKSSMGQYAKKIGSTNEGILKILEEVFETYGVGKPEVVMLDNKKKIAIIRIRNSPLAAVCKKLSEKECVLPSAALAGMFSFLFKTNMDCTVKLSSKIMECQLKEGKV